MAQISQPEPSSVSGPSPRIASAKMVGNMIEWKNPTAINPYIAVGHGQLDDVIDPAETRQAIWRGLQVSRAKRVDRPWRKHGVLPV